MKSSFFTLVSRFLCCVFLLSGVDVLRAQDFEGRRINRVDIAYQGTPTVDASRLRGFLSTRAGQRYSAAVLDEDVRSLYESGLVEDVRFLAQPSGGGVVVKVMVKTRPKFVSVGFQGNTHFSSKKLAKVAKLKTNASALSDADILAARRRILEHYLDYGYPDAMVSHRSMRLPEGNAQLVFLVNEGKKSEIDKIIFRGNHAFDAPSLRKEMKSKPKGFFSFFTKSGRVDNQRVNEDLESVLDFYRDHGYLKVQGKVLRQSTQKGKEYLIIDLHEGSKYSVSSVALTRTRVIDGAKLSKVMVMRAGKAYSLSKIKKDIKTIRSYYGVKGYADAHVTPEIRSTGAHTVSLVYRIEEGTPSKVGRVTIEGNEKTKDKVIRRELPLNPGDPFNSVALETTRHRLKNMNYFDDVQVSVYPGSQQGYRDINILVNEKKTGSISFGVGFSSVDSIVGYVQLEQTNFDITNWPSFTGGGQRFNMRLQAGSERTDFQLSLTEPWFLGQRLSLTGELFYRDALYYSSKYEQSQYGGALTLRKPMGKHTYIKGGYRIEKIKIDVENDTPAASAFWLEDGEYVRSAFTLGVVYDNRDSLQLPRKGQKLELSVTYAGGLFGGDVDDIIVEGSASKFWNLWGDTILNIKGAFAVSDTHGDANRVPIFDRQFLGGPRSLRGFEHRDIGNRDASTKEALGGLTSFYATIEYTFPLVERVRGAVFYDLGSVGVDAWEFGEGLYQDAGVGLRLNLPFGPLAIDYAFPLSTPSDDEEADKGGQFNFYIDYKF